MRIRGVERDKMRGKKGEPFTVALCMCIHPLPPPDRFSVDMIILDCDCRFISWTGCLMWLKRRCKAGLCDCCPKRLQEVRLEHAGAVVKDFTSTLFL